MNTSNSFNICPRCGNSNTLNAKYCSRCGAQLKVPEEAVVCYKCHTRNSPLANFCRNCGTTLKVGSQTKICPRCGNEVGSQENVCKCGYSFVTLTQQNPTPVTLPGLADQTAQAQAPAKKLYSNRGGKGIAIAALILLLLLAYIFVAPALVGTNTTIRPWINLFDDQGIVNDGTGFRSNQYGLDFVLGWINVVKEVIASPSIATLKSASFAAFGTGLSNFLVATMVLATLIVMAIHLIVAVVRCFTGRRSKRGNLFFLICAIITTIAAGLVFVASLGVMPGFLSFLNRFILLKEGVKAGYMLFVSPLYFWFFWIYSLCAKAKEVKEQAA